MQDAALSPHFTLAELTQSQTAVRRGLDNTPDDHDIKNLKRLAQTVLEPLRAAIGRPLVVTSGLRKPRLNAAVGGVPGGDHEYGRAVDLIAPGYEGGNALKLAQAFFTRAMQPAPGIAEIDFDQLIYEGTWVHISIPTPGKAGRRQVLTARFAAGKKTVYLPGLVA